MAQLEIESEVQGNVWKVLVSEGDRVTSGQVLMIIESMKMEIPVEAPADGQILAMKVAEEQRVVGTPMITLATAHPAKFPDAVESATGVRPPLPPRMADLFERDERVTRVPNDLEALKAHILGALSA